jgi:hypothetical protein
VTTWIDITSERQENRERERKREGGGAGKREEERRTNEEFTAETEVGFEHSLLGDRFRSWSHTSSGEDRVGKAASERERESRRRKGGGDISTT